MAGSDFTPRLVLRSLDEGGCAFPCCLFLHSTKRDDGFTCSIQKPSCWNRSPLLSAPQPLENSEFNFRELRGVDRPQFTNGSDSRVGGDALRDKRAVFEERNLHLDFKLRATERSAVEDHSHNSAVSIGEGDAKEEDGPDFLDHAAVEPPNLAAT